MKLLFIISFLFIINEVTSFIDHTDNSYMSNHQIFITVINQTHFACDNDTLILPLTSFNDDFCDCEDGSDENKTNACINGKFKCRNQLYFPSIISTYKLDDNHCDCCDGSDESSGKCENTCIQQSKKTFMTLENDFIKLKQVVNSYNPEQNEEYFAYHIKMIGDIKRTMNEQIMLKKKLYLVNSYIRHIELRLNEENYNDPNFIDGNNIKLVDLRKVGITLKEKIDANDAYIGDHLYMARAYVNFGIFKDISDDCFEVKYEKHTCEMCLSKLNCRQESKGVHNIKTSYFGMFQRFEGNVAIFENGERCNNYNVNLSAEIKFECGAQESFKLVKKENKCLYKFVYYTKLGCNTNKMEEMFNKINSILDNV